MRRDMNALRGVRITVQDTISCLLYTSIIILDKLIAFITNLVGPHNISTFIEFIYIYISCFFLYKGNILPAIIGLIFYCIIISYYNKKNVVEYQNKYIYAVSYTHLQNDLF